MFIDIEFIYVITAFGDTENPRLAVTFLSYFYDHKLYTAEAQMISEVHDNSMRRYGTS